MYGRGWPELIELAQPAAGALATRRIPGETFEAIVTARSVLTTGAAVANRFPGLDVLDGDGVLVFTANSPTAVVAATTRRTYWADRFGAVLTSPSGDESLPFSGALFPPGFTFRFNVSAIDVGDQLSALSLIVWRVPSAEWAPSGGAIPWQP